MGHSSEDRCSKGHRLRPTNVTADGRCRQCWRESLHTGTAGSQQIECPICHELFRALPKHLRVMHSMGVAECERSYPGTKMIADDLLEWRRQEMRRRMQDSVGRPIYSGRLVVDQEYWWTDGRIVAAIQRFTRKRGRAPWAREWRKGTKDHPCTSVVRLHFGTFTHALEVAGVLDKRKYRPRRTRPRAARPRSSRRRGWQNEKLRSLTAEQVIAMREAVAGGAFRVDLAAQHGMTAKNVQAIVSGQTYRNVGGPITPVASKRAPVSYRGVRQFTDEQVIEIRERARARETYPTIAADFGVVKSVIGDIARGQTYRNVGGPITRRYRPGDDGIRRVRRLSKGERQ